MVEMGESHIGRHGALRAMVAIGAIEAAAHKVAIVAHPVVEGKARKYREFKSGGRTWIGGDDAVG
jgi:hypothetical protein